jgi:hypothetical protein
MALSSADFGLQRVGRILSDRIGSKSTTHRIGIQKAASSGGLFSFPPAFVVLASHALTPRLSPC